MNLLRLARAHPQESINDRPMPISDMLRISRRLSLSGTAGRNCALVSTLTWAAGEFRECPESDLSRAPGRGRDPGQASAGEGVVCYICLKLEYTEMSVRSTVTTIFGQVAKEQRRTIAPLSDELKLLDSGLDSLSFAIIVVKLEDEMGFDPFSSNDVEFPVTFGDFVRMYEAPRG
jgi:acyl carrier protein